MYCQKCGTELPNGAVFCGKCGTRQDITSNSEEFSSKESKITFNKREDNKRTSFIAIVSAIAIALIVLTVIIVVAVKKKNAKECADSQMEDSVVYNSQAKSNYSTNEDKEEKHEEKKNKKEKNYAPSSNWSDFSFADAAIQIDDTIYWPGMSMEEFASLLDASNEEYEFEYNKDRIVTGNAWEEMYIYKNGEEWIDCWYINPSESTNTLDKCQLKDILVSDNAKEHCCFMCGISYGDILNMTYDDVKSLGNNLLKGFTMQENSSDRNDCFVINCYQNDDNTLERSKWTGNVLEGNQKFHFYIDQNSGKVADFSYSDYYLMTKSQESCITDISELTQEELEELTNESIDILKEWQDRDGIIESGVKRFDKAVVLEQYMEEGKDLNTSAQVYDIITLFELVREDGNNSYVKLKLESIYRGSDGITYGDYDIGYESDQDPRQ